MWAHIVRFAPQLESLTVYFQDRMYTLNETARYDSQDQHAVQAVWADIIGRSANTKDVWNQVFDYGAVQLPLLTQLTLSCTARLSDHFALFSRSLPSLTEITLACHFSADKYDYWPVQYDAHGIQLPSLRKVTVHGDDKTVYDVLSNVLPVAPQVRSLVCHVTSVDVGGSFVDFGHCIAIHTPLENLAIYSPHVFNIVGQIGGIDGIRDLWANIRTLVLNQTAHWINDRSLYPLLDQVSPYKTRQCSLRSYHSRQRFALFSPAWSASLSSTQRSNSVAAPRIRPPPIPHGAATLVSTTSRRLMVWPSSILPFVVLSSQVGTRLTRSTLTRRQ